jgi:hypothetical protein
MHEHLEVGALPGEVAEVLHPHHVHIQGDIIPLVEVGGCSDVDDDVHVVGQLVQRGCLQAQVLAGDVSGQRNNLVLDERVEPLAVLVPQEAEKLRADHLQALQYFILNASTTKSLSIVTPLYHYLQRRNS